MARSQAYDPYLNDPLREGGPGPKGQKGNDPRKKPKKKPEAQVVAPGELFIRTSDIGSPQSILCYLGMDAPKVVDGYAMWTLVPRKRRKALLEFTGKNPLAVEVSFLINRYDQQIKDENDGTARDKLSPGLTTENQILLLEKFAGRGAGGMKEPPKLLWYAHAPHDNADNPGLLWVVERLEWGESMRNDAGNRIRQWGTMTLREWVGDEFISSAAEIARNRAREKGLTGGGTYEIKKGDTLQNIARRKLGDARRWPEILKLNKKKLRDPKHLNKYVGKKIRIPKI